MNEQMTEAVREATSDVDLTLSDIPKIDLYLDQILSLVAEKNEQGSDRYKERMLTKTMINNYSKEGAILPIKGKKYNRRQILQILLIYSLKNTLSIGEIKRMLTGVDELEDFEGSDLIACYDRYLDTKEDIRAMSREAVERMLEEQQLSVEDDRDFLVFLLSLVAFSSYTNGIARALIAARYPDPELLERERKERAEEEKAREKEERKQEKEKKKKSKDKDKASAARDEQSIEEDVGVRVE